MTPDQIYFLLCDFDMLKKKNGRRVKWVSDAAAMSYVDNDGYLTARDAEGRVVKFKPGKGVKDGPGTSESMGAGEGGQ